MGSKIFIIFSLLLVSCASMSGDWGPWYRDGAPKDKMVWNFCNSDMHGPDYHGKGLCYPAQECRDRKTILGNKRTECRTKMLFCPWPKDRDISCLHKHNIFYADIIINK